MKPWGQPGAETWTKDCQLLLHLGDTSQEHRDFPEGGRVIEEIRDEKKQTEGWWGLRQKQRQTKR